MNDELHKEFCELYTRAYFLVYRRLRYLLRDPELAHDLAQESFYKVVKALQKGNREVLQIPYLIRLATNLCIDHLRTSRQKLEIPIDAVNPGTGLAVNGRAHLIDAIFLQELLDALPPKLRSLAVYRYVDGYNLDELARTTGIPKRTLQRRLQKLNRRLAAVLARKTRVKPPPRST